MKVLIDCRCLQSPPPRGGVGVLAEGIVRALIERNNELGIKNDGIEWILFANGLVDPRRHLPQFDAPNVRWMVTRWPNKLLNVACSLRLAATTRWSGRAGGFREADVVFLPNLNFIPRLPARTKLVVTVHDLSFEHFPDCFTVKQRLWHHFIHPRKLLQRADAIIAVSETTKRDVVETYGIPDSRIHVIHPGIGNAECRTQNAERSNENPLSSFITHHSAFPFILTISEISPRKNLDGLITAFEQLVTRHSSLVTHLVIAGIPGSATPAIRRQIARSPARDRIHLIGPVDENEKRALIARAACFAYVSLWEGVGFPALEAMAEGCPVVSSTGGSLPEILGDAALLVDPLDPAAIADVIYRVLTDSALRSELIPRGRARAARFQWTDAAKKLHGILTG
ncbi:MAG: glycosyltransferase family 1 protein [bacterium]|nr:glycosyltransferase family 1 protein [bacterium]